MDVTFETQEGKTFTIELGYFDTILEIKEKILKYQSIPVDKQTLVFNGRILEDESDIETCEILHNSHIQLDIESDHQLMDNTEIDLIDIDDEFTANFNDEINVNAQPPPFLAGNTQSQPFEAVNAQPPPFVTMNTQPPPFVAVNQLPPTGSGAGLWGRRQGTKKLTIKVLSRCETKKVSIEVNASDKVNELRKELQKLNEKSLFPLPEEGYFFIHKESVMEDDKSFHWHQVCEGDTIEVFNGYVTEAPDYLRY